VAAEAVLVVAAEPELEVIENLQEQVMVLIRFLL
tara:strand:- start:543 stop:644 length:102 start_codon:yes stop_codon:yes gene_type:complete